MGVLLLLILSAAANLKSSDTIRIHLKCIKASVADGANQRGSLTTYTLDKCADALSVVTLRRCGRATFRLRNDRARGLVTHRYADALSKLAEAVSACEKLLRDHSHDSYEVHVALRTLRTVVLIERLQPSREVDWGMETAVD